MAVTIVGIGIRVEAELFGDQVDIFFFACEERPSPAYVLVLGVLLENLGRVALGIDGDGIKENIFAHFIAKHFLHLDKARRLQRAGIDAVRVDHVKDDDLAPDQIVIKMDGLALLSNEFDVGKVIGAPARVIGQGRAGADDGSKCNGGVMAAKISCRLYNMQVL